MNNTTFVNAANLLGAVAGRFGLVAPGFRTPPRIVGVQRTVRRRPGGGVVAVAVKNRPVAAVLAARHCGRRSRPFSRRWWPRAKPLPTFHA